MEKLLSLEEAKGALIDVLKEVMLSYATEIQILSEERYNEVLIYLGEHYYPDELVYTSFNVKLNKELENLDRESFKENISLIAIDKTSNRIIGALISDILRKDDHLVTDKFKDVNLKAEKQFELFGLTKINCFERYHVNEIVYYSMLSVDRTMRNNGLGKLLVHIALKLDKRLGFKAAEVACSSIQSKKIIEGFGFDHLFAIQCDKWLVNGRSPFTDTGLNKSVDFYGSYLTGQN